ncbi:hypothetical protein O1L68_39885 [Streptomyces lydicus]|nr:hypothetical protein [Streptomyces lydicus]
MVEEALRYWRHPTAEERQLKYVVPFDVNVAFGAGANGTVVGTCAPYYLENVPFDPKLPGSWLYDLSGVHLEVSDVNLDDLLPSPFTPNGLRPTGPSWYETRTINYAIERGFTPHPTQANVRPNDAQAKALRLTPHPPPQLDEKQNRQLPKDPPPPFGNLPYADPWYQVLRNAFLETYQELGVEEHMDTEAFLAQMAQFSEPAFRAENMTELRVLSAIKQTFKGTIGKLRERNHNVSPKDPHARWHALDRPMWRPDHRAAYLSRYRTVMHRKIMATYAATGKTPLAVSTDCLWYASETGDIREFVGHKGGFTLGCNPGYVKPEPVHEMQWYVHWADQDKDPTTQMKKLLPDSDLGGGE